MKKQSDTKQSEKQSQLIIVLTSRQAGKYPFLNKHNEQYGDRCSHANVLRACQQKIGLNTKFRVSYRRKAATARPSATLNRTVLYWTVLYGTVLYMQQTFRSFGYNFFNSLSNGPILRAKFFATRAMYISN